MSVVDRVILLEAYQTRIAAALDEKLRAVAGPQHSRAKSVAAARWALVRLLREYQLFKHTRVFDPIINSKDFARATQADILKSKCLVAGDQYRQHVAKWSLTGTDHSWPAYEVELRLLMAGIKSHLSAEASGVSALLRHSEAS